MAILPYINFNGNCREAVEYYADVFGVEKPRIMLYGDMPPDPEYPMSDDAKKLVMHTNLMIQGTMVMFSDVPPGMPFVAGNNVSLTVVSPDIEEIKRLYELLKAGGEVQMELQETFWSKSYGFVVDKYGIGWQLSHDTGSYSASKAI